MPGKILVINPGPKKKRHGRRKGKMPAALARWHRMHGKARTNPRGKKRRARQNPRLSHLFSRASLKTHVLDPVVAASIGGSAAVALDVGLAYLPLPDAIKSSQLANLALKIGGAIALGWGAGKVMGKDRGRLVTTGALTVAAYSAIRDGIKKLAPDLTSKVKGLGGIADYVDYAERPMGALQYSGAPLRGGLGLIESQSAAPLGGSFDSAFDQAFE